MRKKHYNSVEAIGLLLQGKKMCIEGHNHGTGYYFDISYAEGYEDSKVGPKLVEHNGDGSIYSASVEVLDNGLLLDATRKKLCVKKKWIVAIPEEFNLKQFPETLRKEVMVEVIERQPKISTKTFASFFNVPKRKNSNKDIAYEDLDDLSVFSAEVRDMQEQGMDNGFAYKAAKEKLVESMNNFIKTYG